MSDFNPLWLLAIPAIVLVLGSRKKKSKAKPPATQSPDTGWWFGPLVPGHGNYSIGMPRAPTSHGQGWSFDLGPGQEVDAIIRRQVLRGKREIAIRFSVEGAFRATNENPAQLCVMFQRKGDNWSGTGSFNFYRWYSRRRVGLTPGEHELVVPLVRAEFSHVQEDKDGYSTAQKDAFFAAAMDESDTLSIALGSQGGASHGVRGNPRGRLTLRNIEIR